MIKKLNIFLKSRHIYEKRSNQEEIFKSLSLNDLDKMFKNMLDPNTSQKTIF